MTVYLHFENMNGFPFVRTAYEDEETAVAEAVHQMTIAPSREPKPTHVADESGTVLVDNKALKAALAKKK